MSATNKAKSKRKNKDIEEKRFRHLEGVVDVDARDYEFLKKFMTEQGKILPRRLTGASARQQRQIKRAIKRARILGLLR